MILNSLRARLALGTTALVLAGSLIGCASAPVETETVTALPPTMAPDQSTADACKISGAEIDALVLAIEQSLTNSITQATTDMLSGEQPSIDLSSLDTGAALESLQSAVTNPEVSAAVDRVFVQLNGFAEIKQPESVLGAPGYIQSIKNQIDGLTKAGNDLAQLCGVAPVG